MRAQNAIGSGLLLAGLFALGNLVQSQDKPSPEPEGSYGTPKAVFEASFEAMKKKDFATFMRCFTAKSQDRMTVQLAGMGPMVRRRAGLGDSPKGKDAVADFDKALAKHGLTKEVLEKYKPAKDPKEAEKATKALATVVKDKPAFAKDVMTIVEKLIGSELQGGAPELKDLKITGVKACGLVIMKRNGREAREPMDFVKVGGNWRIVLPDGQKGGKGIDPKGPPPPLEEK